MKVVNIIQRYFPAIGGSETWCQGVCRYLARTGWQVSVLTMNVFNEEEYWKDPDVENCIARLGKIDLDEGVFVRRFKRNKIPYLVRGFFKYILDDKLRLYFYGPHSLSLYMSLFLHIKNCDIVHLHTIPYPHNFIGYLVGRILGKKVVITPHFHPGHNFYERPSNYWLLQNCEAIFAVSDFEKDYFIQRNIPAKKIFVSYNALEPQDYLASPPEEFKRYFYERFKIKEDTKIVIFIGRKIEYKGLDLLINAVRKLISKQDIRLFLIGPSFPWFDEFYNSLSCEEKKRIVDLGIVSHKEKVNMLHLADLLVLPSKHEAFGIVFLEAWLCGKPVIGGQTGTVPDLLKGAGLICPLDNIDVLSQQIEYILNNKEIARNMGCCGKEKVLRYYTWDKVGASIEAVYKQILSNNKEYV